MDRTRTPTRRTSLAAPSSTSSLTPAARPKSDTFNSQGDRPRFNTSLSTPSVASQQRYAVLRQQREQQRQAQQQQQTPQKRTTSPNQSNRFQSPTTTAAANLVNRIANYQSGAGGSGGGGGSEALELFSQLQQIVVQLSSRAVEDRRALANTKAQLDDYARLVSEQETMIEELRFANSQSLAEIAALKRQLAQSAPPTAASVTDHFASNEFAKALVDQLRNEQRERVLMEEQHARLLEEQQRSIRNLEARLRSVAGGGDANSIAAAVASTAAANATPSTELSARRAGGSPLSSRRAGGTPSRFAQQRAAQVGTTSPVAAAGQGYAFTASARGSTHSLADDDQGGDGGEGNNNATTAAAEAMDERGDDGSLGRTSSASTAQRPSGTFAAGDHGMTDANLITPHRQTGGAMVSSPSGGGGGGGTRAVDVLTGVRQRDQATQEAFRRFAEAIHSVKAPGETTSTAAAVTSAQSQQPLHVSQGHFSYSVGARGPGLRETGTAPWQQGLRRGASKQGSPPNAGRAGSSSSSAYPSPPQRSDSQMSTTSTQQPQQQPAALSSLGGGRAGALSAAMAGRPISSAIAPPPPTMAAASTALVGGSGGAVTAKSVEELITSWRREHLSGSGADPTVS